MPNLVMIGPVVWPPILDRQNLYYIDIPGIDRYKFMGSINLLGETFEIDRMEIGIFASHQVAAKSACEDEAMLKHIDELLLELGPGTLPWQP